MATAYDEYAELAKTRAATQGILATQFVQTALITGMAECLTGIHAEMEQARSAAQQGLAIQQELLRRDTIQARLEEFVYQVQKLLSEMDKPGNGVPTSTRFFLLKGILETVRRDSIATPIVRGRENKAAFDDAIGRTKTYYASLENDPDVIAALEWAGVEERRRADANARRQAEVKARLGELQRQLQLAQAERVPLNFMSWYKLRFSMLKKRRYHVLLWYPGCAFLWIWSFYHFTRQNDERKMNSAVDAKINAIRTEMRSLGAVA